MTWDIFRYRRVSAVFALFFASGCVTTDAPEPVVPQSFAQPAAADVIAVGFDNISDKYIEPVAMARIGIEGLRGLGAIDEGLTLEKRDGEMIMREHGLEIGRLSLPPETDVRGWAAAVVTLTEKARAYSPSIKRATSEKIYEAIFDGALSDLDIFSRYAGNVEAGRNRAKRDGFGGIGIRFRKENGTVFVTDVLKRTPASESGIRAGDQIVRVSGKSVADLSNRQITRIIRGPVHTSVTLTLKRTEAVQPFSIDVQRMHIVPRTVFTRVEDGISIIRVKSFNQDTADSLERALKKLQASKDVVGIVLDLRGNPGGLLRQSIKVADLMLTQGDILSTVGRHPESLHHYAAGGSDLAAGLPIVVMVDGKSASAAEIVAAALQDRDRAVVIGTSSYGKGSVQTVIRLPNDGEITLTWSRFVAPSGYYLHGLGVVPTICTSGHNNVKDVADILEATLNGRSFDQTAQLRHRAALDDEARKSLRSGCPSEKRVGPVDLEVAKRLILDRSLHTRALRLSTVTAAAIN